MAISSPTMADKYGERESIFFVMIEGEESSWITYIYIYINDFS